MSASRPFPVAAAEPDRLGWDRPAAASVSISTGWGQAGGYAGCREASPGPGGLQEPGGPEAEQPGPGPGGLLEPGGPGLSQILGEGVPGLGVRGCAARSRSLVTVPRAHVPLWPPLTVLVCLSSSTETLMDSTTATAELGWTVYPVSGSSDNSVSAPLCFCYYSVIITHGMISHQTLVGSETS